MEETDIIRSAQLLEAKFNAVTVAERKSFAPEVSQMIRSLRAKGAAIPGSLLRMDTTLGWDNEDGMFDNMPI